MKILFIGLGSIAKRHIKNIRRLYPDFSISVFRQHSKESPVGVMNDLIDNVFFSSDDSVNWSPDAVFITNPAPLHVSTAIEFVKLGCHIFMEKPLSDSLEGCSDLIEEIDKQKIVFLVGYSLRFLEPLKLFKQLLINNRVGKILSVRAAVGSYLPNWRPGADYRDTVTARKDLGGGVVLELSHEIDLVRWLVGEVVEANAMIDKVSDLEVDVEDLAVINLKFKNGAIGNIYLDLFDHGLNRSCRVVGAEGTIVWDYLPKCTLKLFQKDGKVEDLWDKDEYDNKQLYDDEIIHFFDCIKNNKSSLIDILDGKRTLEVALAAKRSAELGETIKL